MAERKKKVTGGGSFLCELVAWTGRGELVGRVKLCARAG